MKLNRQQSILFLALAGWATYSFGRAIDAVRHGRELRGPNTALLEQAGRGLVELGSGHLSAELFAVLPVLCSFAALATIGWFGLRD